mgnify:CR=1 FL=1
MLAKYDATNVPAMRRLIGGGAKLGYWSRPIMDAMRKAMGSDELKTMWTGLGAETR